jgi:dihydroflavonol-4-reductase
MRHAFVTGATGFVGRHLVAALLREGWRVSVLARSPGKARALGSVEVIEGDLAQPRVPASVDAVFHVAANIDFAAGRERIFADNAQGTTNLIEGMRGGRLVFVSTAGVWGLDHPRFDERSLRHPTRVTYLQSKLEAERRVQDAVTHGLDAVIVNPGHILGAGGAWDGLFTRMRAGQVAAVPPGVASWCHVEALVEALLHAFERGRTGANYLLGGADASYGELTSLAAGMMDLRAPKIAPAFAIKAASWFQRDLPRDLATITCGRLCFSSERAIAELGYRPRTLAAMLELSPHPASARRSASP